MPWTACYRSQRIVTFAGTFYKGKVNDEMANHQVLAHRIKSLMLKSFLLYHRMSVIMDVKHGSDTIDFNTGNVFTLLGNEFASNYMALPHQKAIYELLMVTQHLFWIEPKKKKNACKFLFESQFNWLEPVQTEVPWHERKKKNHNTKN